MKRKIVRWTCTNCGKPLKNNFIEFCPRCNTRLAIKKLNYKQLAILMPIALVAVYFLMYLMFIKTGRINRSIDTFEEFNIVMITCTAIYIVSLSIFLYFHKKRNKKDEEYAKKQTIASMELKKYEIELNDKHVLLLIISFLIILPTILIPAYIDIKNDGIISSNPVIYIPLIILGIFVCILPFIIGYSALGKPEKKLFEEDN